MKPKICFLGKTKDKHIRKLLAEKERDSRSRVGQEEDFLQAGKMLNAVTHAT